MWTPVSGTESHSNLERTFIDKEVFFSEVSGLRPKGLGCVFIFILKCIPAEFNYSPHPNPAK